jgi:UDP-N-acetylmuramoyl-tripeptide--D-alanyl-D-alanine ligase
MNFWAYPLLFHYLALFAFWMPAIHRQILFWLYLWQVKEYHLGRFLAHFETWKGKTLFFNPLYLSKIALLAFGIFYYFQSKKILLSLTLIAILFVIQGLRALWGILRFNLVHPELTKKSLMLIAASHIVVFGLGLSVFNYFLGEMNWLDLFWAAICLLGMDILSPLLIGLTVLILQPLTDWQKKKIIKQAKDIIAGRPDLVVIGITGSYGKSGVKELLAHILAKKYKVVKTQANQNTEMGVSQTIIKKLKPVHQFFICEIGAVHKGKIKQTADIVKPKIGILTGINQQHLGVFGNQQNIIAGKFELLEALPENGTAVLNWNSKLIEDNFEHQKQKIKAKNIILVGKDIWASDIKINIEHLTLNIGYKGQKIQINTNARGAWMAETILLAISGALAAGMDFSDICQIISQIDFTPFNIKIKLLAWVKPTQTCVGLTHAKNKEITVIDSTYSANPDGVMGHLDYLKQWPNKKVIIMPCLIELGKESKSIHFEIGKKIAQTRDLAIIATKDRFKEIKTGALSAGMKTENIILCDKPKKIGELLQTRLAANDIILLEGRLPQPIIDLIK